ncbi:MAG: MoxR family ATPase [Nitrososphaerota archaeon]
MKIQFVDLDKYEEKALAILKTNGNLRLIGETGTGKTTLVYYLCEKYNWKLFEYSLNQDTSKYDLLGYDILEKGETKFKKGIIINWLECNDDKYNAYVLYLDEYNYANPNIRSLLNSLTDFRKKIYIPELNQTYERTEKHYIIISYNPAEKSSYIGTFADNIAQLRRFESIRLSYMDKMKEVKYLQKITKKDYDTCLRFVEWADKIRRCYLNGELSNVITTGNLINYLNMLDNNNLTIDDIIEIASNNFIFEEKEKVIRLFGENKVKSDNEDE